MKGFDRIQTGKKGEDIAVAYLKSKGYQILERNYRCPFGEVDIVAKDRNTIVFVEVKSRRSDRFGDPQLAVGQDKQKKLSKISLNYLQQMRIPSENARFDVVAVKMYPEGTKVELIRNAFELAFG
jgi:putative endonuclease